MSALVAETGTEATRPRKKGAFKDLKFELQQIKTKWGDNLKPMWNKPPPPWPVRALRIIPQPKHAEMYDVDELRVRLIVVGPLMEELPVQVEIAQKSLPAPVRNAISSAIVTKWKNELQNELTLPEHLRTGWQLQQIFEWCEKQYGDFLRLLPGHLEQYFGENNDGVTIRRFAIVEVVAKEEPKDHDSESSADEDDTKLTAAQLEALELGKEMQRERERERRIEQARVAEQKRLEAERKKQEAMELREKGMFVPKAKPLSKKELKAEAEWKAKHKRMAKTGPAKKKFEGEGHKAKKKS
jgi:hypothetical protein